MTRLKSRELQIPGGFRWLQPETGFQTRPFASFQSIVNAVCVHRRGNKALLDKGLATDPSVVADEVEAFQVRLCEANGWTNYLSVSGGGAAIPFQPMSSQDQKRLDVAASVAKKLWSGIKTISDWLEAGAPSVPQAQAESRAATCVACPFNGQGGLESWFTRPAANSLARQLERVKSKQLFTNLDDKLGVCSEKDGDGGCLCVNKISVHVPIEIKVKHMAPGVRLHPSCWVTSEMTAV